MDGTLFQQCHGHNGQILYSDRGILSSCVIDPLLNVVVAGGDNGNLVFCHPI